MCSARYDDEVIVAPRGVPSRGRLTVPTDARGIVMSARIGDGTRHSVAGPEPGSAHLATLSFELLSDEELRDDHADADVELLATRFLAVTRWVRGLPACAGLSVGFFGAGTAGVAALWAASEDTEIVAVVARDSRLELARSRLPAVFAPTLLVVATGDPEVRLQNERCGRRLRCEHRIAVVPEDASRRRARPERWLVIDSRASGSPITSAVLRPRVRRPPDRHSDAEKGQVSVPRAGRGPYHPKAASRVATSKQLGLADATAMGVGGMIGGGIFSVLGVAIALAGNLAFACFILGAILAGATAWSYAGVTRRTGTPVGRSCSSVGTVTASWRPGCSGCWCSATWSRWRCTPSPSAGTRLPRSVST